MTPHRVYNHLYKSEILEIAIEKAVIVLMFFVIPIDEPLGVSMVQK
jgi:hypothetical protein